MAESDRVRSELIEFLETIARPGSQFDKLANDDNLVDAGVIDSLAVIHIIMYLESAHGINLAASNIDPTDILSIGGILDAIARGA